MSQQRPKISTSFSYETLEETLDIKPKGTRLQIGIPKEIAFQENRIALTPDAVSVLVSNGHEVTIEHNSGEASHFRDKDYSEAGAKIVYDRAEVFKSPILVKSAPIIDEDIPLLQFNQIVISPIHLSVMKRELLQAMMDKRITAISFENLKDDSGTYPIVRSMSEIAGSAVALIAGQYLGSANHGKGVLLGGISGIAPTKVIIIDVSIDRGGCFETSEITSHEHPIFMKYGVIHYCVPNIPSGFARTASQAISNVLMPLLLEAGEDGGFENLIWHNINLRSGIYLFKGSLTNFYLSERFDLKYTDLNLLIASQR